MGSFEEDDESLCCYSFTKVSLVVQTNLSLVDSIGSVDRPVRDIGFIKRVVDVGFGIRRLHRWGLVAG